MDFTPKAPKKHKSAMSHGTPKFSPPNPGRGKKPSNSPNLSKWQNRKEKRKDKQLVVCTCCFTGKDRNMVKCVRCNKWQHGVCYGIFEPTQIEHVCGPCSVRHNIPCTSEEIRAFCMLRNKTEQQRRDFVLMLMARRTLDVFLNNEHFGYNFAICPNEEFLIIRLDVSKSYAERILFYLLKKNIITYEPFFQVNLNSLPSEFHGRYSLVPPPTVQTSLVKPVFASDGMFRTCKVDKALYDACRQGVTGTPEKTEILEKVKAELISQTGTKVVLDNANNPPKEPLVSPLPPFRPTSDVPTASPTYQYTGPIKKPTPLRIPGYVNSPARKPVSPRVFPTGEELFPSASPVPTKKVIKDLVDHTPSPESGTPDNLIRDALPRRTPKFDSKGEYTLIFDWPPNWTSREGRRANEALYPLDINEMNLKSFSPVVGQVGDIVRPVLKSGNAKFGNDNYNAEFSICMSGITVLGWAFGTEAFCTEVRNKLITLKGTYIIISNYSPKPKVPSFLPINHEFEITLRQGSIITPVTVQRDYKNFRARPTNPEKQEFARKFAQGHKTPAAQKEAARKAKKKEPNAKNKLLFLDGQQRMFKYTEDPASLSKSTATSLTDTPSVSSVLVHPAVSANKIAPTFSSDPILPAVTTTQNLPAVSSNPIILTASSDRVLPAASTTQVIPTVSSNGSVMQFVAPTAPGDRSLSDPAVSATVISAKIDVNPYVGWSSSSHIYSGARSVSSGPTPPIPTPTSIMPTPSSILSTPSSTLATPASPLTMRSSSVFTTDSSRSRQTSPASSSPEEGRYKTP